MSGTVENLNAMYPNEPPEAQSIKSMLHIARVVALIFGIIFLLASLALFAVAALVVTICTAVCGFAFVWPVLLLIWFIFDLIIWIRLKSIEQMVSNRQYEQAKSATLIWMILGFIIGGIIVGILVLIAYLKFDPLINAARQQGQMGGGGYPPQGYPPQGYAPQGYAPPGYPPQPGMPPSMPPPAAAPAYAAPAPAPAAPPAAAPAAAPFCPKCGKPTTYIAQYGRYYCYDDKIYV